MITNKIWNPVRENLKSAINGINDETTEIIVIPFSDYNRALGHYPLPIRKEFATKAGKAALCDYIDELKCNKNTSTIHYIPLQDFYSNRICGNQVYYMFLMTDGKNEQKISEFNRLLEQWGARYGERDVYGFYVMLCGAAYDKSVERIIAQQQHLWKVNSANVNINPIRLKSSVIYNSRSEKYVDIPIFGDIAGLTFNAVLQKNPNYRISRVEIVNGNRQMLRVHITAIKSNAQLPSSVTLEMSIGFKGNDPFTFLCTKTVQVRCENKKEYTLRISVK